MLLYWFIGTLIKQFFYQTRISWWERRENFKFFIIIIVIFLGFGRRREKQLNTFFNLWDILSFSKDLREAMLFHPKMTRQLLDPKHKGIRAWEYGLFLSSVSLKKNVRLLDVGSGGSALPFYLAKKGVRITAFDLEHPLEKANRDLTQRFPGLTYDRGSMLDLPYPDETFDLVLCITAIEHLDYDFEMGKALSYNIFLKQTKRALMEMVRVLKPKGRLFLTTDLYFPKLTTNDLYAQAFLYRTRIGAAFKREDFEKVFIDTLVRVNCSLIGKTDFDFEKIFADVNRANFRGRYFTTFSIYAQKT